MEDEQVTDRIQATRESATWSRSLCRFLFAAREKRRPEFEKSATKGMRYLPIFCLASLKASNPMMENKPEK
jgi:hypothetical protein